MGSRKKSTGDPDLEVCGCCPQLLEATSKRIRRRRLGSLIAHFSPQKRPGRPCLRRRNQSRSAKDRTEKKPPRTSGAAALRIRPPLPRNSRVAPSTPLGRSQPSFSCTRSTSYSRKYLPSIALQSAELKRRQESHGLTERTKVSSRATCEQRANFSVGQRRRPRESTRSCMCGRRSPHAENTRETLSSCGTTPSQTTSPPSVRTRAMMDSISDAAASTSSRCRGPHLLFGPWEATSAGRHVAATRKLVDPANAGVAGAEIEAVAQPSLLAVAGGSRPLTLLRESRSTSARRCHAAPWVERPPLPARPWPLPS